MNRNYPHFAIPEIYGETLSYYELLHKLVNKMNEMIENYDTIPDQIAEAVANLDASQLFSAVLNQLIHSIATDNTKSANAVKVYKKHDLLYATFNETVNLYESLIDFTTGTETELIVGTNIREVNISELFIELRKLIDINKHNIDAVTAVANENSAEITTINNDITAIENKNTEQDNELSTLRTMLSSPYNFKGEVSSISALPASGQVNDTYYVQDVKYKVTWTGSAWVQSSLSEADYETELSELKGDLDNLQNMKKILDYTSFENGYFNVEGFFYYNSGLVSNWMGHRKYLSVGNAKKIVFRHSYSEQVEFDIYKYAKDKSKIALEAIQVEPNTNYYHSIGVGEYFYAISISKSGVNDFTPINVNPIVFLIEYDCTATKEESVIPNIPQMNITSYATVGTKGTEDYSDIGVAYNAMQGSGLIKVEPMNIDCSEYGFDVQKLYMIGCAKELVKLENNKLNYPYASALIKNECVVENIHFKAGNTVTDKNGAYAIHIEHNNTQGKTMVFRNCIFESEFQSGVGVGLRKDMNLIFDNCEFINKFSISDSVNVKKPDDYSTSGALFFHGSIDSENLGTQHITCRNCTFKSDGAGALRIEDIPGNLVVATFVNCNFYSKYYGTMNPIDIVGGAEKGYLCGNSVKLGKSSHGNNIPQLNVY